MQKKSVTYIGGSVTVKLYLGARFYHASVLRPQRGCATLPFHNPSRVPRRSRSTTLEGFHNALVPQPPEGYRTKAFHNLQSVLKRSVPQRLRRNLRLVVEPLGGYDNGVFQNLHMRSTTPPPFQRCGPRGAGALAKAIARGRGIIDWLAGAHRSQVEKEMDEP